MEVYDQLEGATPEERADIVLELIERHPEHRLELPERDGKRADLSYVNLSPAALRARLEELGIASAPWGDDDLQGANLLDAKLQRANLAESRLDGVDLSTCDLTHISISGAWLDRTRLRWEQLGGAIGEELEAGDRKLSAWKRAWKYGEAKRGYLTLKQNFDDLGDYDAASKAYCKERRMEKCEACQSARAAFHERKLWTALARGGKVIVDQVVEWVCDYGESWKRVILSLVMVWLIFALFYGLRAGVWGAWQETATERVRSTTRNPVDLILFSLGTMVTVQPPGLEARSCLLMRVLMPLEALLGIFLTGLLGFVAGNRIRRS